MIEKDIEKRLVKRVKDIGGLCLKFTSPGFSGVPDRIILLKGGRVAFAELKAPHKKERPLQVAVQRKLRDFGFTVYSSVDSYEAVERVVCDLQSMK